MGSYHASTCVEQQLPGPAPAQQLQNAAASNWRMVAVLCRMASRYRFNCSITSGSPSRAWPCRANTSLALAILSSIGCSVMLCWITVKNPPVTLLIRVLTGI